MTYSGDVSNDVMNRANQWLSNYFDPETRQIVQSWIRKDPNELEEAFWKDLEFGTGGMRGLMGTGSARMNTYTVQKATQGLCNWLKNKFPDQPLKSVIAFDSRHQSQKFALDAARVFAANKIDVWIFPELRPVPMLSFAIRHLNAHCGIMITASHNPSQYNGFKAYNQEGCQFYTPDDAEIVKAVEEISYESIQTAQLSDPFIHTIDTEIDNDYFKAIAPQRRLKKLETQNGKGIHIVYSSLHGAGITLTPNALLSWGFKEVDIVNAQAKPDGNFPSVITPNPEDPSAMEMGIQQMLGKQADLLLANDPDSDRLGVAVIHEHKSRLLNGQEIAVLLTDFLVRHTDSSTTPPKAVIKSMVTSNLIREICKNHGIACFNVPTGFKFVGRLMAHWEKSGAYQFLLGAEESHGYLAGIHARDKDGVIAACLISELALECKLKNKTLVDRLEEIYKEYGYYGHRLLNLSQPDTPEGSHIMASMMTQLKQTPPEEISGLRVINKIDLNNPNDVQEPMVKSNTLIWTLENETEIIVRPSGTEPKIKVYISTSQRLENDSLLICMQKANRRLDVLEESVRKLFVAR